MPYFFSRKEMGFSNVQICKNVSQLLLELLPKYYYLREKLNDGRLPSQKLFELKRLEMSEVQGN